MTAAWVGRLKRRSAWQ